MKRVNNIYHKIYHWDNLLLAEQRARRGKEDTYGVQLHDRNRVANLKALQKQLIDKTYVNPPYDVHRIYEPKERDIYKLPFIDRILHHAIMNILEPIWVKIFTADTYSCIKGRGIHSCLAKVKKALQQEKYFWNGEKWEDYHKTPRKKRPEPQQKVWERQYFTELPMTDVEVGQEAVITWRTHYSLKLDIRKFYPSIDHDILKEMITWKIKDEDVLWLLGVIIDSAPGVPIGNYLSQYFANLYLAYFDHWAKEVLKVKYYYRYADDIVILSHSKEELHDLFWEMEAYVRENLKLVIKPDHQVFPVHNTNGRSIDLFGYDCWHTHVQLRKRIKAAFAKKAKSNLSPEKKREVLASYMGWAIHCESRHLVKSLNEKYKFLKDEITQNTHLATAS